MKKGNAIKESKKYFPPFSPSHGYTLIELLVVIGVIGSIGTILVSILFISVRGTRKSDTIEIIRQNGDAALSQMIRQIRYAKTLNAPASCVPSSTATSITITSVTDNAQTTFSCAGNTISSNSASLLDTNAVATSACSFTCSQASTSDAPTVTIQYTLTSRTVGGFLETNATIPFQTSVFMRNLVR